MSSTGGKTSPLMLEPLTLSVDHLEFVETNEDITQLKPEPTPQNAPEKGKYAQRLQNEFEKLLGYIPEVNQAYLDKFADPAVIPSLKLTMDQIHTSTKSSTHPLITPSPFKSYSKVSASDEQTPSEKSNPIKVAPRAKPFSETAYVAVKVIPKPITLNGNAFTPDAPEHFCWMQRDAIKNYLTIQEIERQRTSTDGAVYSSVQTDV